MPYSRRELNRYLDPNLPPIHLRGEVSEAELKSHSLPPQYLGIREWVKSKGSDPQSLRPDLQSVLQGVEGLLQIAYAYGEYDKYLNEENILLHMSYVTSKSNFVGGSLKQYPELWTMLKKALTELPKGPEIIRIIQSSKQYKYLK